MQQFHAGVVFAFVTENVKLLQLIGTCREVVDQDTRQEIARKLRTLEKLVEHQHLPVCKNLIQQMIRILQIPSEVAHNARLASLGNQLIGAFPTELGAEKYLRLDPKLATYHGAPQPFGPEVADRFPTAIDDIEGAANCLAFGQGTATVLHLMRVMEVGLKDLAKRLKIGYQPDWGAYLREIQQRVGAKRKTKSIRWKRDEPFFLDVSGDLLTVKQAFRNRTMHVGRKYGSEEAEEIFRGVRSFMQRLAIGG